MRRLLETPANLPRHRIPVLTVDFYKYMQDLKKMHSDEITDNVSGYKLLINSGVDVVTYNAAIRLPGVADTLTYTFSSENVDQIEVLIDGQPAEYKFRLGGHEFKPAELTEFLGVIALYHQLEIIVENSRGRDVVIKMRKHIFSFKVINNLQYKKVFVGQFIYYNGICVTRD